MNEKNYLVPAWMFQTIALVLCLTCLIGLMFQLGMFPPKVVTFTSEYRNSVTLSTNPISLFFDGLLFIFWSFIAIKCFGRHCMAGGIGAVLRVIACAISICTGMLYLKLSGSDLTYEDVMPIVSFCSILGYASVVLVVVGIILLVLKADISNALKIGFAVYPIVRLIAVNGLGGYVWYPWIELAYAVGLLVWSLKESNNKQDETKHA